MCALPIIWERTRISLCLSRITVVAKVPGRSRARAHAWYQLCALGFEPAAVEKALEDSGWSLEVAANRLMG